MTIEEQLKQVILEKYKSVRAFTMANNISYSTVDSIFKRGIGNSGVSTIIKIFSALNLDVESIPGGTLCEKQRTEKDLPHIDQGEETLVNIYREMNQEGQEKLVDYALDLRRTGEYKKAGSFRVAAKEV